MVQARVAVLHAALEQVDRLTRRPRAAEAPVRLQLRVRAEGVVHVSRLHARACRAHGRHVPLGVVQGVSRGRQRAAGVIQPGGQGVDIVDRPEILQVDVAGRGAAIAFLQQLPAGGIIKVGGAHRGRIGFDPAAEGVIGVFHLRDAGRAENLDDPVPGVVDELLAGFVGRHAAVGVESEGRGTHAGDLILGVVRTALPGAVGGKGLPVAHRVEVPGLGPRGRSHSIEDTVAVGVGQHTTGEIGELVEVEAVTNEP